MNYNLQAERLRREAEIKYDKADADSLWGEVGNAKKDVLGEVVDQDSFAVRKEQISSSSTMPSSNIS